MPYNEYTGYKTHYLKSKEILYNINITLETEVIVFGFILQIPNILVR